ncbi:CHASE3 domain sensor protein [Rhizobium sp. PP-F2F-G48]|uniref:CHASE3 domain-containing protein n=1 Tax=Rhizobium sp. PP-F2F-G48 TaxID=2135651 RepID=UPI00104E6444|nr:CHASE3 domain-containing protein [Rhizobium sp. PP-F2F-G48]TCM52256.1 CHASE3 domain sensor protein [Rhizobium sp. PP-F2F-G48]
MVDLSFDALRARYLTTPVLLRSIPVGIVIAAGVVATTWTHMLLSDHQDLVIHTYEVIDTTKDVLIGLDDSETGQRGYLLSGDRRYLDPYDKALSRLSDLRITLRAHISDNPEQITRVETLNGMIDDKLGELKRSIDVHDTDGFEAARKLEIAMMERATMDGIRRAIGSITESEKALLSARQSEVDRDEMRIRIVAILVGLASFLTRAAIELYLARRGEAGVVRKLRKR